MVCVVIIAGGKGERFWPKSRECKPKQFTDLTGKGNMLYLTYKRICKLVEPSRVFVVTGKEYKEITSKSLPDIPEDNIIIEPEGRNTAPCIGLAAFVLEKRYPGSTMVILPADHLVKEEEIFCNTLQNAISLAEITMGLVTIGIKPNRPETGYGYLKLGDECKALEKQSVYKVAQFVEKPDLEKARLFLAEGGYLWNGGIFVWKTSVIIDAFKRFLPDSYQILWEIGETVGTADFDSVLNEKYCQTEKVSIDYGIMEKATEVFTVPGDFDWDDIGSWKALERIFGKDEDGNLLKGNVIALNTQGTIADAGERLVALIGVEDLIVVDTDDITFVCHKDKTDLVRELLKEIRSQKKDMYL